MKAKREAERAPTSDPHVDFQVTLSAPSRLPTDPSARRALLPANRFSDSESSAARPPIPGALLPPPSPSDRVLAVAAAHHRPFCSSDHCEPPVCPAPQVLDKPVPVASLASLASPSRSSASAPARIARAGMVVAFSAALALGLAVAAARQGSASPVALHARNNGSGGGGTVPTAVVANGTLEGVVLPTFNQEGATGLGSTRTTCRLLLHPRSLPGHSLRPAARGRPPTPPRAGPRVGLRRR